MAVRNVSSSPIRGYTCGHVGCCDSSRNKHATKHFAATAHPINVSYERGEEGGWCYVDQGYFESPTVVEQIGKPVPPTLKSSARSATRKHWRET